MVTKASLTIESDDITCAVSLAGIDLDALISSIICLSHKEKLQVIKLDESFKWTSFKELQDDQ